MWIFVSVCGGGIISADCAAHQRRGSCAGQVSHTYTFQRILLGPALVLRRTAQLLYQCQLIALPNLP